MRRKTNKTLMTVKKDINEVPEIEVIEISGSVLSKWGCMEQKYQEEIESGKIKPKYDDNLISQYEFVRKNIYEPTNVFYPCSDFDASPLKAFPNSRVTIMDNNQNAQIVMRNAEIDSFIFGDVKQHTLTADHTFLASSRDNFFVCD